MISTRGAAQRLRNSKRNIYVISNESIPNHYKVGQTKRDPELRAKEMGTYAPLPYEVEHVVTMSSDKSVHSMLHRHGYFSANDNEWFEIDLDTLKGIIELARLEELDLEALAQSDQRIDWRNRQQAVDPTLYHGTRAAEPTGKNQGSKVEP